MRPRTAWPAAARCGEGELAGPMRLPQPRLQFSLLAMQVVVASLAILLGIRVYVDPHVHWHDLWILPGCLAYCLLLWLTHRFPYVSE